MVNKVVLSNQLYQSMKKEKKNAKTSFSSSYLNDINEIQKMQRPIARRIFNYFMRVNVFEQDQGNVENGSWKWINEQA